MEKQITFRNFWNHPRFYRHAAFWVVIEFFLTTATFHYNGHNGPDWSIFSTFNVSILAIAVWVYLSFYAYNKWVKQKFYAKYTIAQLLILALIIPYHNHVQPKIIDTIQYYIPPVDNCECCESDNHSTTASEDKNENEAYQKGRESGKKAHDLMEQYPFLWTYIFLAFAFFIKIVIYGGIKKGEQILQLRNQRADIELQILKTQVNPHFLFNILNAIYSINLSDRMRGNDIILELSDLLRHQIEQSKYDLIPLADEIQSVENYIHLEELRIHNCEVQVHKEGDFDELHIGPLLLNPIVENAFKYGAGVEASWIKLHFAVRDGVFHFTCQNKIVESRQKKKSTGIGIQNVTDRLAILYPDRHTFRYAAKDGVYTVQLTIQLQESSAKIQRFIPFTNLKNHTHDTQTAPLA